MPRPRLTVHALRRGAAVAALIAAACLSALLLVAPRPVGEAGSRGGHHALESPASGSSPAARAERGALRRHAGRGERPAGARGDRAGDRFPDVAWRDSVALGSPESGSLERGVRLPRRGRHFFTWDPIERRSPNRPWRRWGTDELVRTVLRVLADHRRHHPGAPRVGVGDLSRPHGGDFGPQYGFVGHATHQNGLDVDVYYPLESGRQRAPRSVAEVDLRLAQDLVDRFVAVGAEKVFVGPATGLTGPPGVVQAIPYHDNHLHVRIPAG